MAATQLLKTLDLNCGQQLYTKLKLQRWQLLSICSLHPEAPSYANIFMGNLEKELLSQSRKKPTVWWRYIDDVFALWTHGEESLNNFIGDLNQAHPTIKFTAEWSKESVSFLDTTVKLEDNL